MTVTALAVRLGDLRERLDAGYALTAQSELSRPGPYQVKRLGDMALLVQYGSSALASSEPAGTPILRMNNLQDDGWDVSDLKYVEFSEKELARYRLRPGDLLINRTNGTKELVGKSQVFRDTGDWVFASYLIRMRFDETQVLPGFVSAFLNSDVGRTQVSASSRQILQTNISATELRNIRLPVPTIDVQRELVDALHDALVERDGKLNRATAAVASIGSEFMRMLDIPQPPTLQPQSFAVPFQELKRNRLDPPAFRPIYSDLSQRYLGPEERLDQLADIDAADAKPKGDLVPYVGLPECDALDVRRVVERPYGDVRGRKCFWHGDLLFARIEPSVFNMKYPWARNPALQALGGVYTSTEFYVVRPRDIVGHAFLFASFRSDYVQAQVRGRTTGSSGRRRIDRTLFAGLSIPTGSPEQRKMVSEYVVRQLDATERLRLEAEQGWAAAKWRFEAAILGRRVAGA